VEIADRPPSHVFGHPPRVPGVTVTLLGGFAAAVDGTPVPESAWRLKKARELVKLLALAPGRRLHREQPMDLLWPDRAPAAAANNLNQAVHVARRALGPEAIEVRDELLILAADVDVDRFELAAAEARRVGTSAAYRAALSTYVGELLPENRYDDWAQARREALAELHGALGAELAALGPDDRLRRLPADTSSFVGRSRELAELRVLLGRTRLLTLSGVGGAGKSRLALELARRAEPDYPAGAALVELAAVSDPRLVTDAVAAALDVRALPGRTLVDALVDFLTPRTTLLLVDNCEHLLAASATLVAELLRAVPGLTVVATSREPLRVAGEVVFRVPSLAIPHLDDAPAPKELLRYEAVRLFVDRAAAAAPSFALDDGNAVDVARICVRLDGMPLALELASGRLGALDVTVVAERLDDRFRLLRAASHTAPTRQQTLEATLQWSHDLLEPDEQLLFRRLGVFAGGFELDSVEAVCASDGLERAEILDVLARLVEKSLVTPDDVAGRRRYRLLETVRVYARDRLDAAGETAALADRHAGWALDLAERERDRPELDREAANLRAALDRVLATRPDDALRLCVALWTFWLRRIDLTEAYRRFDDALAAAPERTAFRAEALLAAAALEGRGGVLLPGQGHAEESLEVAVEVGDARAEWRALQFLGEFAITYDAGDAFERLEQALALAHREGYAAGEALGIYALGVARWFLGDRAGAETLLAESIEVLRGLDDLSELVPSPVNITELRAPTADGRLGFRIVLEDSVLRFVEISCEAALAYALANQASIARARGDFDRAGALLDESAERFRAAGNERGQTDVLVRRAYLRLAEGSLSDARDLLEQVLAYRRDLNDRRGIGLVLAGLALIETDAGHFDAAERRLDEAFALFRRAGDRWGLVIAHYRSADLELARKRPDAALAALEGADAVLSATHLERWNAHTRGALAEVALMEGDPDRARRLLEDARDRYAARNDALGVAATEERLTSLAEPLLSERKEAPGTTARARTSKRKDAR
jgi:predicted ATPase